MEVLLFLEESCEAVFLLTGHNSAQGEDGRSDGVSTIIKFEGRMDALGINWLAIVEARNQVSEAKATDLLLERQHLKTDSLECCWHWPSILSRRVRSCSYSIDSPVGKGVVLVLVAVSSV